MPEWLCAVVGVPLFFVAFFAGRFILTLLVSLVGLVFYSPLFLISYIVGWIQKICSRKKS